MKNHSYSILFLSLSFLLVFSSCVRDRGPLPVPKAPIGCAALNITYASDIKPIILANCAIGGCHDNSGGAPGDYTQYNMVKSAVDAGLFQDRALVVKDMPPAGALPDSLIVKINCWLDAGAPDN